MLLWYAAAAVFLRLLVESAAGRALRLVVPGVFEPAGLEDRSAALRPTMDEAWDARSRRSAAASMSSLLGPLVVRDAEEPRKGLIELIVERAPAPSAEAILVGRGVALVERSVSL